MIGALRSGSLPRVRREPAAGDDGTIDGGMQRERAHRIGLAITVVGVLMTGCGLAQKSPDLFVLTRSGAAGSTTMVVSDGGTIRCNGGSAQPLSDSLLLKARDLADGLDIDAKAALSLPARAGSVYRYTIRLPDGTVSFADTAAGAHRELSQAELFAAQALQGPCKAG
jgi:hypothetical protein